jgi:glucose-6-phosphate 1-dehydrogenase
MSDSGIQIETHERAGEPILRVRGPDPCVLVIFGASGDLAQRKLVPALYNLAKEGWLPENFAMVSYSRSATDDAELRAKMKEAVAKHSRTQPLDEKVWERFARRVECVPGDYNEPAGYARLRQKLLDLESRHGTRGNRLYYCSTPASVFPSILGQLSASGLIAPAPPSRKPWSRLVVEKPFGRDLATARELNRLIAETMDESQIYRIDHYLGKETVQNILVFRFANSIFEPLWNSRYIDHVEITAAEEIGIEGRGKFYDETGVLRDMVQNHLLQVLTLIAMEPPVSFAADDIRDEKNKVLRALRPLVGGDVSQAVVRAQYRGYTEEPGVAKDSRTPTFVAMKVMLDNWRWQGVPFYIRAGKKMARRATHVSIHFQAVPHCLFGAEDICQRLEPNVLTLRIQPQEGMALQFECKVPGEDLSISGVTMEFGYASAFQKQPQEAYERLLLDCMRGNATLFARRDGVEEAWKFITPVLEAWDTEDGGPIALYEPGSAGPKEADDLVRRDGRRWTSLK